MDKKELKFYEAPASEVVELKLQSALMTVSNPTEPELPEGGEGVEW